MKKLTDLAKSPQGKKLVDKAQQFANDPKTKEQVEKAKTKLAGMRSGGSTGGTAGAAPTHDEPDRREADDLHESTATPGGRRPTERRLTALVTASEPRLVG